ncbi:MAG: hypothetical protein KY456_16195 [Chloroflexi bacterium]|nr:hypothetical protein [Chloroflexota bacterium]
MTQAPTFTNDDGVITPRGGTGNKTETANSLAKGGLRRAASKVRLSKLVKANWIGVDASYNEEQLSSPSPNPPPSIELTDTANKTSIRLRGNGDLFTYLGQHEKSAGLWIGVSDKLPGRIVVRAGDAQGRVIIDAADSSISLRAADGSVRSQIASTADGCRLQMFDGGGNPFAYIGDLGGFGGIALGGDRGFPGRIELLDQSEQRILLDAASGEIALFKDSQQRIVLDAATGDITLMNADCAEEFDLMDHDVVPGTVLVLDDEPGRLRTSDTAYDTRVAGVVSGAGEYKPGIVLDRRAGVEGRRPVALMGKVFCQVEAESAAVRPGTLLTTSSRPGFAMAATDRGRAFGAVLGKALTGLESGCDLVPVLVALQ